MQENMLSIQIFNVGGFKINLIDNYGKMLEIPDRADFKYLM